MTPAVSAPFTPTPPHLCNERTFTSVQLHNINNFLLPQPIISSLEEPHIVTMKLFQSILSVAGLASIRKAPNNALTPPALSTEHPASIWFSAWLSAFNTADRETLLAYHIEGAFPLSILDRSLPGPASNVDEEVFFSKTTGGFEIAKIESSDDPSYVVVVVKEKERAMRPHYLRANMSVDTNRSTYPVTQLTFANTVTQLDLVPLDDPRRAVYKNAMAPLTAEQRRAVIDGVINELRDHYVDPAIGEEAIATIEACFSNGTYDNFEDNEQFSYRLSMIYALMLKTYL